MALAAVKYYSGTTELIFVNSIPKDEFGKRFPEQRGKGWDFYSRLVGSPKGDTLAELPVTRIIEFQKHASLHKCDARCQHARGRKCECSCGGQFHGAGA